MVEIREEDYEWAAINRMSKMLKKPHAKFQTTHTLACFSSILCWTIQRLRTQPITPETNLGAREVPQGDTYFQIFDSIQLKMLESSIEEFFGKVPKRSDQLNLLTLKDDDGQDISALAFGIALRNALAHGDGRKVKPVNRSSKLVGFEFSLSSPKNFPDWQCQTQLNRSAMAQIAGKLADDFCSSFRSSNHKKATKPDKKSGG